MSPSDPYTELSAPEETLNSGVEWKADLTEDLSPRTGGIFFILILHLTIFVKMQPIPNRSPH